ncbi:putative aig2 family protein [Diaporthe ampelina]|uniref:gamma-glutamylcyclotransferase n=1 Tax=Diaporthe ampelina TaxID=1214573 RepID=A0A0G2FC60_9PEZI|nr:putative aig2 family protein [Diaporthe ampelina]
MLSHHPLITASDRLYFAYGSNLRPAQMAHRCPDSIFLGKATLNGHRWQINERGVANVVPVSQAGSRGKGKGRGGGDVAVVEGLLYAISAADERRLDRYEGVAKGRYERFEVVVDFEPVRDNVFARCTSASVARAVREEQEQEQEEEQEGEQEGGQEGEIKKGGRASGQRRARSWDEGEAGEQRRQRRDGGRRGASVGSSPSPASGGGLRRSIMGLLGIPASGSKTGRAPSPSAAPRARERAAVGVKPVVALVYASTVHARDGEVRARYVPRMERAVADAVALGVSRGFVRKHIAPLIYPGARPTSKSSWRVSLAGFEHSPDKGRRDADSAERRSASQSDGPGRRGRRGSVVDRHRDH